MALVVDDEPTIVDILVCLLEEVGWSALPALGPEEALALARTRPVDLVFCDVCMPRMDGPTLVRRLREGILPPSATVVLMSANVRHVDHEGAIFLPKPFDLDEVAALVERVGAF